MPNGSDHNPLNQDSLDKLNQVLVMIPETRRLIAKYKSAGIDVGQAEQENDTQEQLAIGIKRAMFPGSA